MTIKYIFIFVTTLFLLSGCNCDGNEKTVVNNSKEKSGKFKLVWSDEFEYEGLPDKAKWTYDTEGNQAGWGNNEAQHYTEDQLKNAHVKNGILSIVAYKEKFEGKEYTSARLISKADWQYGRVEVKAKLPDGRGTWSAIWMMPGGWTFHDGNWPDIGEIDIMEHVGHDLGVIHASAHSKDYQWQTKTQQTATVLFPDVSEEFHSYILDWTPEVLKAYVDDSLYFEYQNEGLGETKWPYDKPFYLILNLAVGGAWGSLEGIDEEAFPQTLQVDYVRIYQKTE